MATGTNNPPGSDHPLDLRADAKNLDLLLLAPNDSYPDRLGVPRRSWAGINSAYDAAEANRDALFQAHLATMGYELPSIPYAAGISIVRETQLIERLGEFYRAKAGVVPFVTTGVWATDELNLVAVGDAALRQQLAATNGASLSTFTPDGAGAFDSDLQRKGRELATIRDFGPAGTGNGVTDDSAAALAMASAMGFVRFSRGNYVLNTCTLDVPVDFDRKANITVPAANTVTFTNSIESPRQNIFKGAGLVVLGHDSDSGEDARQVHASWFGAFPNPSMGADQAPAIQRACTAMGNGRESVIQFDVGNYVMRTPVVTTRGTWIRGEGQRRTVFKTDIDGFDLFTTGATACRFSSIQFELDLTAISTRNSAFIVLNHDACDVYDVSVGQTKFGIVCNALRYRVRNILGAFGSTPAAGSSLIACNAGQGHVADVYCLTSGLGPESIVNIGSGAAGTISDLLIENIDSVCPSKLVFVNATAGNVARIQLKSLRYGGSSGTPPNELVHLLTSNTRTMDSVIIDGLNATTFIPNIITIEQNSSGSTTDVSIDNVVVKGSSAGYGIGFIRTAGTLSECTVGDNVKFSGRATPFFYSGTSSRINIAPGAFSDATNAVCYDRTIADDSVAIIALNRPVFTGFVMLSAGGTNGGVFIIRAASTPLSTTLQATANLATVTTALAGTTGVDGKLTLGVVDGILYVENRLGSSQRCSINLFTGVL